MLLWTTSRKKCATSFLCYQINWRINFRFLQQIMSDGILTQIL